MIGDRAEDGLRDFVGAAVGILEDDLFQTAASKHIARGAGGVGNAVAEEEKDIARLAAHVAFLVSGAGEQADRQSGHRNLFELSVAQVQAARGNPELATCKVR